MIKKGFTPPLDESSQKTVQTQSSREYQASRVIEDEIARTRVVFEKEITPETTVCLIGDGQGMDTKIFVEIGVTPENIRSVNYEQSEVDDANANVLTGVGVEMQQADATSLESLQAAGLETGSQDLIVLMHALEVPDIRGKSEQRLIENIALLLKKDGEALVSQYKNKLTPEKAESLGVEKITATSLERRFGNDWKSTFKQRYNQEWYGGRIFIFPRLIDYFKQRIETGKKLT